MNSRTEQVAAFVLHSRPYRETSALVDLFTLEYGKVSVVARGVRRPGSKLRHTLQPFTVLAVRFAGQSELKTLHQAELAELLPTLTGKALMCGLYANELLERLLHPLEPTPQLFLNYKVLLNDLLQSQEYEVSLRLFEQALLRELGSWSDLSRCHQPYYRYDSVHGINSVEDAASAQFTGDQLRSIEQGEYTDSSIKKAAKYLMRELLKEQLGDKPLRSRELFQSRSKERKGESE
jgi:DNA repair protein RecO (recombination protein O)